MARHLLAVLRQISLQVIGVIFLVFAAGFGYHALVEWRREIEHAVGGNGHALAVTEAVLAVLFAYFGISSFLRANTARR